MVSLLRLHRIPNIPLSLQFMPTFSLTFCTIMLDGRFWCSAEIFQKLVLAMLGLSTWEIITQLPFDWSIISGKVRLVLSSYSPCQINNLTANMHPLPIPLVGGSLLACNSVRRVGPHYSTFTASIRFGLLSSVLLLPQTRPPRSIANWLCVLSSLSIPSQN